MSKSIPFIGLVLGAVVALADPTEAKAQAKSQTLTLSVPATVKAKTDVTVTAQLTDTWKKTARVGRPVAIAYGQEFSLVNLGAYSTNSKGIASRTIRFEYPGTYRVVVYADYDGLYLSQRTLAIIEVK